ncbi:MAG: tetratricopeptide repeat protein [Pseudonocardia sp.]
MGNDTRIDESSWGVLLREWRENTKRWSQQELVDHVVQLAYRTNAERGTNLNVGLLQKWENGTVRRPRFAYQRLLAELGAPALTQKSKGPSLDVMRSGNQSIDLRQLGTLEAIEEGGCVSVPVCTDTGEVVFVTIPRRLLLKFAGISAVEASIPGGILPEISQATPPLDINPVAHFERMKDALVDSDNLFGPRRVIPVAKEQVAIIRGLRGGLKGADRRALLRLQAQYAELLGWLYQDTGEFDASRHWVDRALEWADLAADTDLVAIIFMRKAQLAGDMADRNDTADLAEVAIRMTPPRSRLSAIATTYSAHGYALMQDAAATERAYDRVREALATFDSDSPWGPWFDAAYVEAQRARSLAELGNYKQAIIAFESAISDLDKGYPRDRGVYAARAALFYAKSGEPERAAELGLQTLSVGTGTGSGRIMSQLANLADTLAGIKGSATVDFCVAFDESVARTTGKDARN